MAEKVKKEAKGEENGAKPDDAPEITAQMRRSQERTAKPRPAPVVEPEPEPAGPAWDEALLQRAHEAGLTDEEAQSYGSPAILERTLDLLDRTLSSQIKTARQKQQQQPATDKPPEKKERKKPTFAMIKETYGDDVAAAWEAAWDEMDKGYQEELESVRSTVKALQDEQQLRRQEEFTLMVDKYFDSLGDEYKDIFGKGPLRDLKPESPQYKARVGVVEEADVLAFAYRTAGRTLPNEPELLDRARRMLHAEKAEAKARREVSEKLRDRQGQFVARPTARAGGAADDLPKGEERARQKVAEFLEKRGRSLPG